MQPIINLMYEYNANVGSVPTYSFRQYYIMLLKLFVLIIAHYTKYDLIITCYKYTYITSRNIIFKVFSLTKSK